MGMDIEELNKFQKALKKIGNLSTKESSKTLSNLIKKEVKLKQPNFYFSPPKDAPHLIEGPQELVVVVYTAISSNNVSGTILVALPTKNAFQLIDLLENKKPGTTKLLNKSNQIKLTKIFKNLSKTYLKSITDFLRLEVKCAESRILTTFGEALTDLVLLGIEEQYALLTRTKFSIQKINGDFILLLATNSFDYIFKCS